MDPRRDLRDVERVYRPVDVDRRRPHRHHGTGSLGCVTGSLRVDVASRPYATVRVRREDWQDLLPENRAGMLLDRHMRDRCHLGRRGPSPSLHQVTQFAYIDHDALTDGPCSVLMGLTSEQSVSTPSITYRDVEP